MSSSNLVGKYLPKIERVNYIVPERIREAARARGLTYNEAADKCKISRVIFGKMANGHIPEISKEYLIRLVWGLGFPKSFYYQVKWYRQ